MKIAAISVALACLVLGGCAGTREIAPSIASNAAPNARPGAQTTVDIRFVNESNSSIQFSTAWSYPWRVFWADAHTQCVARSKNWHTFIDFNHADPEVRVNAIEKGDDCNAKRATAGNDYILKNLELSARHGIILAKVVGTSGIHDLRFCVKEFADLEYRCKKMDFR